MIEKLDNSYIGVGETKGFLFNKVHETRNTYIYSVQADNRTHYEVFEKKSVPKCIDFKKRIYSETEFRETYPNSKKFGKSAWTKTSLSAACKKSSEIENRIKENGSSK